MSELALETFPPGITSFTLHQLQEEMQNRESLLQGIIQRFTQHYACDLATFEARLARGEGAEHPDWEDSIEWRNAVETLQQTRFMRSLLEWLLRLSVPLRIS
ncbi:MAG TPA: hypothetical protein PKZ84_08060 [Anaerolineae bacterium]|nr:hypothetical protein [Anaerolineae bacterium]HQI84321.1 hypothetical protein [Anaerolineae bacterium]